MSVYKLCSQAVRDFTAKAKPFTELDVIDLASADSWNEADYKKAMTQANQIVYAFYRSGRLTRFGPVSHLGENDYVRAASKIVYAGAKTGPQELNTPNGTFPRLMVYEDGIASVGRRTGTNRDDFRPWPLDFGSDGENLQRTVTELKERIERLEREQETVPAS